MKKITLFSLAILALVLVSGCAEVSNVSECLPETEHTYGFWAGTWHGLISGFAFIGTLFRDDVAVYAINNNGGWYDFGFVGGFFLILRLIGSLIKAITR